jgi:uncharacterized RDD family membrane protein YckC
VNEVDLSPIPPEARPYQGHAAGIVTRVAANTIDALLVGGALLIGYASFLGVYLVVAPRSFQAPDLPLVLVVYAFLSSVALYQTSCWTTTGYTLGNHVMGLQVVDQDGNRLGLTRSFTRAVLCEVFPPGLLWCVVGTRRRSMADVVLRTAVVYNWVPRLNARR